MKAERVDSMALAAVHCRRGVPAQGGDCFEALRLGSPIAEVRQRNPVASPVDVDGRHRHDALRVRVGQGPEQHALDDAEDGGCRADASPSIAMAAAANPGDRVSRRRPYRKSVTKSSSGLVPRASRHCSLTPSMPPIARRARRAASDGERPASTYFRVSCSRCSRSSSSSSSSTEPRRTSARRRNSKSVSMPVVLGEIEDVSDDRRQLAPRLAGRLQLFAPGSRQLVVFARRLLPVVRQSALIKPPRSRRCSDGYSDPWPTCSASREICFSRSETAQPCSGSSASAFRISRIQRALRQDQSVVAHEMRPPCPSTARRLSQLLSKCKGRARDRQSLTLVLAAIQGTTTSWCSRCSARARTVPDLTGSAGDHDLHVVVLSFFD